MNNDNFGQLRYLLEKITTHYSIQISESFLKENPVYLEIEEKLNSHDKVLLYFQVAIKFKLFPIIYNLIKDHVEDYSFPIHRDQLLEIKIPKDELNQRLLDSICKPVPALYKSEWFYITVQNMTEQFTFKNYMKGVLLNKYAQVMNGKIASLKHDKGMVAIKFAEGFNLDKRSDIACFLESGIDPERILIFYDELGRTSYKTSKEILSGTQKYEFKHICLKTTFIHGIPHWHPLTKSNMKPFKTIPAPKNEMNQWISHVGKKLLRNVNYWLEFKKTFDVKILFNKGERSLEDIAQNIAFGLIENDKGFIVSHQRSELIYPSPESLLGIQPKDIFFVWNQRTVNHYSKNTECHKMNIITGYPYDAIFKKSVPNLAEVIESLKAKQVTFLITLFDNMSGNLNNPLSQEMIKDFYLHFIDWLREDRNIGLLIKSKKKAVLERLPKDLRTEILSAKLTGRCLFLDEKIFPAEVSRYSDFAVGIGISSAITESAIIGSRAIHCDLTKQYLHPFYKWGHEKIIFDDIHKLIAHLKNFKNDPSAACTLGDWSPVIDQLDPFCDGQGGKRIGKYLHRLLEGFDKHKNSDRALQYANELYMKQWGTDKVIWKS